MVRANKPIRRSRITKQVRRKWSAKEKFIMIIVITLFEKQRAGTQASKRLDENIEPLQH